MTKPAGLASLSHGTVRQKKVRFNLKEEALPPPFSPLGVNNVSMIVGDAGFERHGDFFGECHVLTHPKCRLGTSASEVWCVFFEKQHY